MLVDEVPNREGAPPKIDAAVAGALVEAAERMPNRLGVAAVAPKSEPDAAAAVGADWPAAAAPPPKMEPVFAPRAAAGAAVEAPASRGAAPASLVPAGAPRRLVVAAPSAPPPLGAAVVNVPISAEKPGSVFAALTDPAGAVLVVAAVPGASGALAFDKTA